MLNRKTEAYGKSDGKTGGIVRLRRLEGAKIGWKSVGKSGGKAAGW